MAFSLKKPSSTQKFYPLDSCTSRVYSSLSVILARPGVGLDKTSGIKRKKISSFLSLSLWVLIIIMSFVTRNLLKAKVMYIKIGDLCSWTNQSHQPLSSQCWAAKRQFCKPTTSLMTASANPVKKPSINTMTTGRFYSTSTSKEEIRAKAAVGVKYFTCIDRFASRLTFLHN